MDCKQQRQPGRADTQETATSNPVLAAWKDAVRGWNPLDALNQAATTRWVVDGVIPANSIIWLAGAPAEGKTFVAMDMAACVSSGRAWMGRQVDPMRVVYLAAEGGTDVHVRRAAAELAAGVAGALCVVQARPIVAEREGFAELAGLVHEALGAYDICFDVVEKAFDEACVEFRKYLLPKDTKPLDNMDRLYDLLSWKEADEQLTGAELSELKQLQADMKVTTAQEAGNRLEDLKYAAMDNAESNLPPELKAARKHVGCHTPPKNAPLKKLLLVIDTYSATAADDSKQVAGQYIKHLRDLIEVVEKAGGVLSILVVDHFNRGGESFIGAQAKQGDSDGMIEIVRKGQLVTVSCPDKMRGARQFDPIHLELVPYVVEDYLDTLGRPLSTLVVKDGEREHRIRQAVNASDEGIKVQIFRLLDESGACSRDELRAKFAEMETNAGKKPDSIRRVFSRALKDLADDGSIQIDEESDTVSVDDLS